MSILPELGPPDGHVLVHATAEDPRLRAGAEEEQEKWPDGHVTTSLWLQGALLASHLIPWEWRYVPSMRCFSHLDLNAFFWSQKMPKCYIRCWKKNNYFDIHSVRKWAVSLLDIRKILCCSFMLKIVVKSGEFFHCWQKFFFIFTKKDNINAQKQVVSLEYSFHVIKYIVLFSNFQ